MWTYLAAAHALEILKAQHAAILEKTKAPYAAIREQIEEQIANLKERARWHCYTGLAAPATVDSMEPVPYAARQERMSPKAMPEGLSASLPLLSFWLVVDSSRLSA